MVRVSSLEWPRRCDNVFTYLHLAIELLTFSIYVYKLPTLTCKCEGCRAPVFNGKRSGNWNGETVLAQSVRQDIVCVSVLLSAPAQPVIALETHTDKLLSGTQQQPLWRGFYKERNNGYHIGVCNNFGII